MLIRAARLCRVRTNHDHASEHNLVKNIIKPNRYKMTNIINKI